MKKFAHGCLVFFIWSIFLINSAGAASSYWNLNAAGNWSGIDVWSGDEPGAGDNAHVYKGGPYIDQPGEVCSNLYIYHSQLNPAFIPPFVEVRSGGELTIHGEYIGMGYSRGSGYTHFSQTGGMITAPHIALSLAEGTSADFDISAGALNTGVIDVGGWGGPSNFTQTGGDVTVGGAINIPLYYSNDQGASYTITGGTLNAGYIYVEESQNNGVGRFVVSDASAGIRISHSLTFKDGGIFQAAPGTTIYMAEDAGIDFGGTSPADVSGVENLTLVYDTTAGWIEAAGADTGLSAAGFSDNFVIERVEINSDSKVYIRNTTDNNPGAGDPDAVYIKELVLSCGAVLELHGKNVYCETFSNMGGTVDDSSGGAVFYYDTAEEFIIEADPEMLPETGPYTIDIFVTLSPNGVPLAGKTLILTTDMGELVHATGSGTSLTLTTDVNGQVHVELQGDGGDGEVTIRADWEEKSQASCKTLEPVFYDFEVTANTAVYKQIPGVSGFTEREVTFPNAFSSSDTAAATYFGKTVIPVHLEVTTNAGDVEDIAIELSSDLQMAHGPSHVDFPATVYPDAGGVVEFELEVTDLFNQLLLSEFAEYDTGVVHTVDLILTIRDEPVNQVTIEFPLLNNYRTVYEGYENNVLDGAVWDMLDPYNLAQLSWTTPLLASGVWAGVVNNILDSILSIKNYAVSGTPFNRYGTFTCGCYQLMVLEYLDKIRLNMTGETTDWLLNGFNYGPVQIKVDIKVISGGHQATMIWPVSTLWPASSWTKVWDPWIPQYPEGASMDIRNWVAGMGVVIPVLGWTVAPFLQPGSCHQEVDVAYPPNSGTNYPDEPFAGCGGERLDRVTLLVHCPVDIMAVDGASRRIGFDSTAAEGEMPLINEIDGAEIHSQVLPDGTRAVLLDIPQIDTDVSFTGTGDGTFSFLVANVKPEGSVHEFIDADILTGESVSMDLDTEGPQTPHVTYADGRIFLPDSMVTIEESEFDETSGQSIVDITIKNHSAVTIYGPLRLILETLDPVAVTLSGQNGTTSEGFPYIDLSAFLTNNMLTPGQEMTTTIRFNNSGNKQFVFSGILKGYSGENKTIKARFRTYTMGYAESWQMKQRDMYQTGRANFSVPVNRLNSSFFDVISWQTPTPGNEDQGSLGGTSMSFYDNSGPDGEDLVTGAYHWPKGVQGMDRHTGRVLWYGNPDGGEEIAEITPAFSNTGKSIYVMNRYTVGNNPLMAFETDTGPSVFRHNGADATPDNLGYGSPIIGPEGRIFLHGWYDRPRAGVDDGSAITETWSADEATASLKNDAALYMDGNTLKVIAGGRSGHLKCFDGSTGAEIWSVQVGAVIDSAVTIDPETGNIYVPSGDHHIYITGLTKDGDPLWSAHTLRVFEAVDDETNPQRAQSTGCLSHDGSTYYFQTTSEQADGRLYAVNTLTGSVKWSLDTGSSGQDIWNATCSSPVVTQNNVLIFGNNEGDTYFAIQDLGTHAKVIDTLQVEESGNARASATLSRFGSLYLPVRTAWSVSNGSGTQPDQKIHNMFMAFDLQSKLPVPEINAFSAQFGLSGSAVSGDLDKDGDSDGKDIYLVIINQ